MPSLRDVADGLRQAVSGIIVLAIIAFVFTLTFSYIRGSLEDQLDLDKYISLWVLRPLELVMSTAFTLTALVLCDCR
ncbi:hypothetical protein BsWGS_14936 [Bradybaena similaris]